jgi:multidrug resistance efflux pump
VYKQLSTLGLEIYPQVSGTIIEIKPVKTQVEKGDVIVRLDDRQSKLELQYLRTLQSIKQQDFDDKKLELRIYINHISLIWQVFNNTRNR